MRFRGLQLALTALICFGMATADVAAEAQGSHTWTLSSDFQQGLMDGVECNGVPDQLQLAKVATTFPYAWVANSRDGTVSKIDTRTGVEEARYRTGRNGSGDDPAQTAVDIDGSCWISNRHSGTVTKILMTGGVDRNGDGVIDTSTGPTDVKDWTPTGPADERIVIHVSVGASSSSMPRAIAIDASGRIWVGLEFERNYAVLKPNGDLEATVEVYRRPGAAAIDRNGTLWNASESWGLESVSTATMHRTGNWQLGGGYGIAAGKDGTVWLGANPNSGVYAFDPVTTRFTHYPDPSNATYAGRGVCVAGNGNIWVAEAYGPAGSPNNTVTKYNPSGMWLATYEITDGDRLGVNPNGVGIGSDGNVIVVCRDTNDVWKLRESDGAFMWRTPVGTAPNTCSDFTGYVVRNITQQTGTWSVIRDGGAAGMAWGTCSWNGFTPEGTTIGVRVRVADTAAGLSAAPWLDVSSGVLFGPVFGRFIEIEARLTTQSEVTPVLTDLTITPYDTTPPVVTLSVANGEMWPPNHEMVNVGLTVTATDNMTPNPTIEVLVYGDEDDETPTGDGLFSADALDIGPGTLRLRSERKGDGDGRVYLIVVKATDALGNVGFSCCTVVVPHSKSAKAIASVNEQAAAARAFCSANGGAPPPDFFVIGDGPTIGPKQ